MKYLKICCLCLLLLGSTLSFAADSRPYRVAMLLYRGETEAEKGFMASLRQRLPVEFIVRDVAEDVHKIPALLAEMKRLKPDLIYTFGTTMTLAVAGREGDTSGQFIRNIPIVFNIVADPVGAGLTSTLKSSRRNLTGVSHLVPMKDQLNAAKKLVKMKRFGVIYNAKENNSQLAVKELQANATAFGYHLSTFAVEPDASGKISGKAIDRTVHDALAARLDAVYLPSDSSIIQQAGAITLPFAQAGVPVISATEAPIRQHGALLGLVGNYFNAGSFAAYKAEQILLKRASPDQIPIEVLQRFSLLINMQSARQLKRYPPLSQLGVAELLY
ncbi:ABC transporter substrate-binding protein [Chitinibacter sp. S2-10]|uniref:ABC transporter substrate-binding protein n=1 Tax=Chitinibacter sp. S2-10 TaxID=3373597 RepID=UPI00397745D2